MARFDVVVDDKTDPDFYLVTTAVPRSGLKDGIARRDILAQASAINVRVHGEDQNQMTPQQIQDSDDLTPRQKRDLLAAPTKVDWGNVPTKIGLEKGINPESVIVEK